MGTTNPSNSIQVPGSNGVQPDESLQRALVTLGTQMATKATLAIDPLTSLVASGKILKATWLGDSVLDNGRQPFSQKLTAASSGRIVVSKIVGTPGAALGYPGSLGRILSQLSTDIDPASDLVIVTGGANDAHTGGWVGNYYLGLVYFANTVLAMGKIPVICASTPRSDVAADTKYTDRYPFAARLAALDTGAIFVDPYYDWRGTDGTYWPGYSDDHVHPAYSQYWLFSIAAQRIWDAINPFYDGGKRPPFLEVTADADNGGFSGLDNTGVGLTLGNALFQNGTTGWVNSNGTKVALSTTSATPFKGKKMVMDFTSVGVTQADGNITIARSFLNTGATNKPSIGDIVEARAVIECTQAINANFDVTLKSPSNFAEITLLTSSQNGYASTLTAEMCSIMQAWQAAPNLDTQIIVYIRQARAINLTCTAIGTNLTVTAVSAGAVPIGCMIAGTGITAGTTIVSQTSGTPGGAGVYVTSLATTATSAEVLATGKVSISNCDLYNLTKLRSTQYGY